jgi:hypothetical protein
MIAELTSFASGWVVYTVRECRATTCFGRVEAAKVEMRDVLKQCKRPERLPLSTRFGSARMARPDYGLVCKGWCDYRNPQANGR